ncbi:MAG: response regulator [Rhodobacteraceae bacterium]|nr:response regulator [Paracoccaceae bacterium]
MTDTAASLAPRLMQLIGLGVAFLMGAHLAPGVYLKPVVFFAGLGLLSLALLVYFFHRRKLRAQRAMLRTVAQFVEKDASSSFITLADGSIAHQNAAARERFEDQAGATLISVLGGMFASPAAVIHRLQMRASNNGAAREDVAMRRGHLRLAVHQVGDGQFLWRIEDISDRERAGRGADGISLPMLTASKSGTILFMNEALRKLVGDRRKTLDRIVNDLPLRNGGMHEIATPEWPVSAAIVEVEAPGGRRELYFVPQIDGAQAARTNALDALPVAIVTMTAEGQVLLANRPAQDLLGIAPGETPNFVELVDGLGRPVTDWIAETAESRGIGKSEFLHARRGAQDTYVQVTLSRQVGDTGVNVVAVLNDATELKTLEAQFVQSQKMQAIGQLAGGVAHDFNNLLTAIGGHCDLLLLRHDPGDPDYSDLEQINQNANRAASLVGQLLAFSRKQTLQTRLIDLRDTLGQLTHLLNRLIGERITLDLISDDVLSHVRADPRQLEQVMMNLVVNARDAMPDGGSIRVETREVHLAEEMARDRAVVPAGDYVLLRVSDAGTGIEPENLPKVFEPFFTTKRTGEGTGLGLSTVYGIVKQSGGFIFADSTPGSGTSFTLYFPAHPAPAAVAETPAVPEMSTHSDPDVPDTGGVILLVEDEAPVRAFASRALRMRGHTVLEAANAEEALEALDDESLEIDVFVTDVIMPGMDGPSWVSTALERRPETKVVFVSGYAQENFAESQARIPHSTFLPKPFSLAQLTDTVQQQLH